MTPLQQVRLLIGDTVVPYHYTDAQITEFLTLSGGSVFLAAALALEAWAATVSANADSEKIGDYSYSKKEMDNKLALAARYRDADAKQPASDWAEMDLTTDPGDTSVIP